MIAVLRIEPTTEDTWTKLVKQEATEMLEYNTLI